MAQERLIGNGEAARELGLTQASLARWVRQGKLRPTVVTPGGQARWRLDDLREQLEQMRRHTD
jgi:predicted site-specific integrase-resolvase